MLDSDCFFYHNCFASLIITLAAPAKDRSAELMFKRMEALTSDNESASNQIKLKELPLFEFQVLATATDNFSLSNKLGQGGFGPVYKVSMTGKGLWQQANKNLCLTYFCCRGCC